MTSSFTKVRTLTATDKAVIASALNAVGVKARIAKQRIGFRVCFDGSWDAVRVALNTAGFRTAAGTEFGEFARNQSHEVFVRYAA